jgi:cytochrome c-type biogenesis protein CcsB
MVFLIILIIRILTPGLNIKPVTIGVKYLLLMGFLAHTLGLATRWYISGHAPWSNGFESMIYIAWVTMLAGFIFVKKAPFALSATAILSSLTLFVAHLSWMNPEITNLVPVLKSYWLTLHVSIITASYGFLGLGAILGFLNLILYVLKTEKNKISLQEQIVSMSRVVEMALILGLYFLTVGTLLGAVWANESWGRYWGWDPKETWSLITIFIYAFIIHMRQIPGFKSKFALNLFALIGFSSVLMTYFGVNYYLSGLHSYAQGDPVPVPSFVYYSVLTIILLATFAYLNERKYKVAKA